MAGKIVVLGVVILIVILAGYLVHDSLALKKMKEADVKAMIHEAADRGPKILNGPTISYKCPGDTEYHHIQMAKKKINIGKGPSNEIALEDDSVEEKHASIEKKVKGNSVYYEFVNLSRYNPAEYFNQSNNSYEYLAHKQGIVLDDKEGFYIGETKVIITLPKTYHAPSKTERMIVSREEVRRPEAPVKPAYTDRYVTEAPVKPAYTDRYVTEAPVKPAYTDRYATEATVVYKREPSLRAVFKDEIDI